MSILVVLVLVLLGIVNGGANSSLGRLLLMG
jgi:hypothetical protein